MRKAGRLQLTAASALAVSGLLVGSAGAQEDAPSARSAASGSLSRFQLDNGLDVLVVERPGRPLVAAGWAVRAGSASDPADQHGLAHLVEHVLHQGSRTIGTRDWPTERRLLEEQEELIERLEAAQDAGEQEQVKRFARRLSGIHQRLVPIQRVGEAAYLGARGGVQGVDAVTQRDGTVYFAQVPASRLELWFWLESDTLLEHVFRDVYGELPVVAQELVQRVAATPHGPATERFDDAFWRRVPGAESYAWPVGGVPEDLKRLHRRDADQYFARWYRPGNMTLALVGDVDADHVRQLARRYFGRLPAKSQAVATRASRAAEAEAETASAEVQATWNGLHSTARCDCAPRLELRWLSVPSGDEDEAVYDVLAGLLSGRLGRLHRRLVLGDRSAFAVWAFHGALRRAGSFSIFVDPLEQPGEPPSFEVLRAVVLEELRRLQREGPEADELERTVLQLGTEHARAVDGNRQLLLQLLGRATVGDPEAVLDRIGAMRQVSAGDLKRVLASLLESAPAVLEVSRRPDAGGAP